MGVYTSPHLVSVRERSVVDGVPIDEDAFAEWTSYLKPHIEQLDASFFEATTALAFADLAARGVHIGVIEVGMGGRLDATNVITPLVSVVTKIAREHTEYLGSDLASIAREKAGIAKRDVPFVTGERDPAIREVLVAEAERHGANPVILVDTERPPLGPLGLRGTHQHANAWVALAALDALAPPFGPAGDAWPGSFADAYLPGRFEVRHGRARRQGLRGHDQDPDGADRPVRLHDACFRTPAAALEPRAARSRAAAVGRARCVRAGLRPRTRAGARGSWHDRRHRFLPHGRRRARALARLCGRRLNCCDARTSPTRLPRLLPRRSLPTQPHLHHLAPRRRALWVCGVRWSPARAPGALHAEERG
ncbi:MAG: hypothetical protein DMD28_11770 [Gemmatimonadetes bacterium]|nr:MAG: hypothetical protein DMD28_11770 [Gemmatimonadota bacterium]